MYSKLLSRRDFMRGAALAGAAAMANLPASAVQDDSAKGRVVAFSKIYQELKLNYEQGAELTREAGLDGIDCPVRPGGEVLPERVETDLPRYAEALQKRNLTMPFITTAITSVDSPHAEPLLRTAKQLGVQYYRLGSDSRQPGDAAQIENTRARLKELAALNKAIGIRAVFQNHSPSGHPYLGGDLAELEQIVSGLDPAQVGVAFDLGHAIVVHGDKWREHFQRLKSHIQVVYIKDLDTRKKWVRFGHGQFASSGYFKLLKEIGYHAPYCLHIEFDWDAGGKARNRAALLQALSESAKVLRGWITSA